MAFLDELKRRRVVRAASIYLAGVWVVAQVVGELVAPALGLGDAAVRWVAILAAVGFPVVLVLSWAFDLAPDTPAPTDGGQSEVWLSPRSVVAVLVLLLTGAALGWIVRPAATVPNEATQSLAVVPFESLTGEEDRYLSDGLTEDVAIAIQKTQVVDVIGRSSTERYRGERSTAVEIAEALGVQYVLTGSVRRAGADLRVAVQLTDGITNRALWAERYDQALTVDNVFDIYSDVAQRVARSVEAELDPAAQAFLAQRPTESLVAYQLYMRGRSAWARRLPALMDRAVEYFDRAIEADPTYARAHAGRADALLLEGFYNVGEESRRALRAAQRSAERALELDPRLAEAQTSVAYTQWLVERDWESAERSFRRALELDPDYPTAHHWFGDLLAQWLRTDEALVHLDRALELDPYAPAFHFDRAKALLWAERYSESLVNFERAVEIEPTYIAVTYGLHADALSQSGQDDESIEMLALGLSSTGNADQASAVMSAYREGGGVAVDEWLLAAQLEIPVEALDPHFLGLAYLALDRPDEALAALTQGVERRSIFSLSLYATPAVRNRLWGTPGYEDLLRRIGLDPDNLPRTPR